MARPDGIRGILLDIEGTTTPVSFVFDVLFPFAESRLDEACARAGQDRRIAEAVELLREEHTTEGDDTIRFGNGSDYARFLMGQDRKSTGLKALQGVIWETGYESGKLRAQLFADVPGALEAWRRWNIAIRIFSSGSVLAQKLLFAHTERGDLREFFDGYHDTTTGPKRVADSYRRIASAFGLPAETVLFLSDVVEELDAARDAGMRTGLLRRPGNATTEPHDHAAYDDFLPLA